MYGVERRDFLFAFANENLRHSAVLYLLRVRSYSSRTDKRRLENEYEHGSERIPLEALHALDCSNLARVRVGVEYHHIKGPGQGLLARAAKLGLAISCSC